MNGHGKVIGKYPTGESHTLRNMGIGLGFAAVLGLGGAAYKSDISSSDIYKKLFGQKAQAEVVENGTTNAATHLKLEDISAAFNDTALAQLGQIQPSQIYGVKKLPSDKLRKIAKHLNVPPDKLMSHYGYDGMWLATFSRTDERPSPDEGIYGEGYYVLVKKKGGELLEILGSLSNLERCPPAR